MSNNETIDLKNDLMSYKRQTCCKEECLPYDLDQKSVSQLTGKMSKS